MPMSRTPILVTAIVLASQAFAQTTNTSPGYVPLQIPTPPAFNGGQVNQLGHQGAPRPTLNAPAPYSTIPLAVQPRGH